MVAKGAGGFLGGLFSTPGGILLGALGIGLLFFGGDIRKAFGSFGSGITEAIKGIGNVDITLPEITFPEFPEFPEIVFPTFPDFGGIFGRGDNPPIIIPGPGGNVPPELNCECGTNISQDAQGNVTTSCIACAGASGAPGIPAPPFRDAEMFAEDFPEPFVPRIMETISRVIQSAIPDQQFQGGGPSFVGGSVTEIPLERLSLGQIIQRLGVTASQAASLRAEAIGFTPEEQTFLTQGQEISPLGDLGPQTSGGFIGLSPEEIALRLTGGNISNF